MRVQINVPCKRQCSAL